MKIKIGRNIIACVVILMVMTPGVLALVKANPPHPSYITENSEMIEVDGDYDDWNLDDDYFAEMHIQGDTTKALLSTLYLRYDCESETLSALVLREGDYILQDSPGDMWIKEYSLPVPHKIVGMDGGFGNITYIYYGDEIIGYEANGSLAPGSYVEFEAHAQIDGETSSTGKEEFISLTILCNDIPIPEFPTIALPIAAILGLMFILQSRRRKED